MPEEFWREVVDLCAREAPDTLLLAEAFWMMEGYFVRTLGMHRVYNSAFMNMLKREENAKYRETIRNTQEFDKDILKRFVNFMNNPDEETAVAQFGKGDKYFGVCTMMATMPGLPMFGHGQLEGFEEKYGMEYRRAYRDESPDRALIERHEREIFPLLKRRRLFSGVERFFLYDLVADDGSVNENVFAYTNGDGSETALVAYNNSLSRAEGRLRRSCSFAEKSPDGQKRADAYGPRRRASGFAGVGPIGRASRHARAALRALVHPPIARGRRGRSQAHSQRLPVPGLPRLLRGRGRRARPVLGRLRFPGRGRESRTSPTPYRTSPSRSSTAALAAVMTPEFIAWARDLAPASGKAKRKRRRAGRPAPKAPSATAVIKAARESRPGLLRRDARPATRAGLRGGTCRGETRSASPLRTSRRSDARPATRAGLPGRTARRRRYAASRASLAKRTRRPRKPPPASPRRSPPCRPLSRRPSSPSRPPGRQPQIRTRRKEALLLLAHEMGEAGKSSSPSASPSSTRLKALCSADGDDDLRCGPRGAGASSTAIASTESSARPCEARACTATRPIGAVGLVKALLPQDRKGQADARPSQRGSSPTDEELRSLLGFNLFDGAHLVQ